MKFEVTHPKIWEKIAERNIPMKNKLAVYEKMGGAYRFGKDDGEQVFNKLTELLKYKAKITNESEDHEVSMAQGSLESIIRHANELIKKLGNEEKDIPGWIQDHIAKAENYIQQANGQYHEYGKKEESIKEVAGDTYVVYIIDGIKKSKIKETNNKNAAIRAVNTLMKSDIEGAGWMTAKAWEKEPMK